MSTTIKRVALVAVAALGLGVLSVAPSTAAINADTLSLSAATATQSTAETATATSAVATLSFLGAAGDSASVTASLVSAPAGATALPYLALSETTNATTDGSNQAAGYVVNPNTAAVVKSVAAGSTVNKFKVYLGTDSMTAPSVAGTYVVKLTPASVGASGALQAAVAQTLTITVTAAPTLDKVAASATIVLNAGETNVATSDDVVTASKAIPASNPTTTSVATISVALKNAAGTAVTAESYTAVITGPGTIGSGTQGASDNNATSVGRAITVKNGDVVGVFADGTSGVATITISSKAGLVLGSKTVTFFGAPASVTATVAKSVIGIADTAKVLTVTVKDAAGVVVSNLANKIGVVSSDTTKISTVYNAASTFDATTGTYSVNVNGLAVGSANLTVTTNGSSTDTTGVSGAAVAVRVGSLLPASVKVSTDKSSYAPGEKGTLTVQLFDKDGLEVVAGETYTATFDSSGIVSSYALQNSDATTFASGIISYTSGGKAYTFYAPVTEGDVKFSWTTGTTASGTRTGLATANQGVAGSVTISVSSVATSAAIDAANEAAQAASDATDAALAAADAADAATTKAQEAVDAVATLSAQVSKLITALKAQITTLTNLVIKIQKKVKA